MKTPKIKKGTSSKVSLYDEQTVFIDDEAKSVGYFCRKMPTTINRNIINELKEVAGKLNGRDLRLCLHPGPQVLLHEMIVLARSSKYYRAHKHSKREGESFHMLEGKMEVLCFTDEGKIFDSCLLDPEEDFIYRVRTDIYHMLIPLTEIVVYKECKLGPFVPNADDSIYPEWAPEENSPEAKKYIQELVRGLHDKSK